MYFGAICIAMFFLPKSLVDKYGFFQKHIHINKTTILLPDDLQRRAKNIAKKRGTTLSGLIRTQLERVVGESEASNRSRAEDPLFSNWNPSDREIPTDLSSNHDKYLYGE